MLLYTIPGWRRFKNRKTGKIVCADADD